MDKILIVNTQKKDLENIFLLFNQAMKMQGKNAYKVWHSIDKIKLEEDIENKLQYKVVKDNKILCVFSIQNQDPFIWNERDQNDAIYLHRIVVNPDFKGQKSFGIVLEWAKQFAQKNKVKFVRMDTWADNLKLIEHIMKLLVFDLSKTKKQRMRVNCQFKTEI